MNLIKKILNESRLVLNEAKQVGIVYHFTGLDSFISILKTNKLKPHFAGISMSKGLWGVSVTRNKNIHIEDENFAEDIDSSASVRINLDGNKLSERYKIRPFFDTIFYNGKRRNTHSEFEELIITGSIGLEDVNKYIISVSIFAEEDELGYKDKKILNLAKRNGIKCEVVEYANKNAEIY
jgi:hypothetical protein